MKFLIQFHNFCLYLEEFINFYLLETVCFNRFFVGLWLTTKEKDFLRISPCCVWFTWQTMSQKLQRGMWFFFIPHGVVFICTQHHVGLSGVQCKLLPLWSIYLQLYHDIAMQQ